MRSPRSIATWRRREATSPQVLGSRRWRSGVAHSVASFGRQIWPAARPLHALEPVPAFSVMGTKPETVGQRGKTDHRESSPANSARGRRHVRCYVCVRWGFGVRKSLDLRLRRRTLLALPTPPVPGHAPRLIHRQRREHEQHQQGGAGGGHERLIPHDRDPLDLDPASAAFEFRLSCRCRPVTIASTNGWSREFSRMRVRTTGTGELNEALEVRTLHVGRRRTCRRMTQIIANRRQPLDCAIQLPGLGGQSRALDSKPAAGQKALCDFL